ncbi:MAG: mechanosensitive ion channel [Gammaproteobacteria bacterium]|nr:mechanosensitive ion channel [Gammaproteobacteria bacterium]
MEDNQALVENALDPQSLLGLVERLVLWANQHVLNPDSFTQLAIIATGLLVTYASAKKINAKLAGLEPFESVKVHSFITAAMYRFAIPVLLLVWLGVFTGLYLYLGLPYALIEVAVILTLAWAVIRLGSSAISDTFISKSVATFVWSIAALHVFGLLVPLIGFLDSMKFQVGGHDISVFDVVASIITVAVFLWLALLITRMLEARIHASSEISKTTQVLIAKVLKIIIIVGAFLLALGTVGIDLTAFVVFGGAIGVGLGFGLQKIFSNLVAGFILLTDKSIKPGDTINIAGEYGKIETLGARYVSVITRDGIEHLVPNEELITNRVENWSYSHANVRLKIPVGVHYDCDVHEAIELCKKAANNVKRVLAHPQPACLLKGFGDSSVDLEIRIWIKDPMNGCANVMNEVLLGVWDLFHEKGIQIPYPQRDLHLKSVSKGANLPSNLEPDS